MDFIHSRTLISKVVSLKNFTRKPDFLMMVNDAPSPTLRINLRLHKKTKNVIISQRYSLSISKTPKQTLRIQSNTFLQLYQMVEMTRGKDKSWQYILRRGSPNKYFHLIISVQIPIPVMAFHRDLINRALLKTLVFRMSHPPCCFGRFKPT